jgi:hypothetical protein
LFEISHYWLGDAMSVVKVIEFVGSSNERALALQISRIFDSLRSYRRIPLQLAQGLLGPSQMLDRRI